MPGCGWWHSIHAQYWTLDGSSASMPEVDVDPRAGFRPLESLADIRPSLPSKRFQVIFRIPVRQSLLFSISVRFVPPLVICGLPKQSPSAPSLRKHFVCLSLNYIYPTSYYRNYRIIVIAQVPNPFG